MLTERQAEVIHDLANGRVGRRAAASIGERLGARYAETARFPVDPRRVARDLTLIVREVPLGEDNSGFIEDVGDRVEIVASTSETERRRRFTIAHEIGHYVLGLGSLGCASPHAEQELRCNAFASSLLMPWKPLAETLRMGRSSPAVRLLRQTADLCGVSPEAAFYRLREKRVYAGSANALLIVSGSVSNARFVIEAAAADSSKLPLLAGQALAEMDFPVETMISRAARRTDATFAGRLRVQAPRGVWGGAATMFIPAYLSVLARLQAPWEWARLIVGLEMWVDPATGRGTGVSVTGGAQVGLS